MERTQKDLDLFLASIESKLRGPFSSLDLTKTIQTPALRDPLTRHEYLDRIATVMGKTDKITQSRIVIALLGLLDPDSNNNGSSTGGGRGKSSGDDDSEDGALDHDIYQILQQAQEAPAYEEWVRICASLVQGIMYEEGDPSEGDDDANTDNNTNNNRSLMGPEARKLLDKTTTDIIKRVMDVERLTEYEEDDPNYVPSDKADADPNWLAPYRYALLNSELLDKVVPDAQQQVCVHFHVNTSADILQLDARLEQTKASEERDHESKAHGILKQGSTVAAAHSSSQSSANGAPHASRPAAVLPGSSRPGAKPMASSSIAASRPKSSMFMPAKKPAQIVAAKAGATKTMLHARKAGAAQALLMKGRGNAAGKARIVTATGATSGSNGGGASGTAGTSAAAANGTGAPSGVPRAAPGLTNRAPLMVGKGRAAALLGQRKQLQHRAAAPGTNAKSKMMMMDVSEVADLNQQREQQQQQSQPAAALASAGKRKATPHDDAQARPGKLSKKSAASAPPNLKSPPSTAAAQHKDATSAAEPVAAHPPPTGGDQDSSGAGALASAALNAYMAQQRQLQAQQPAGGSDTARQPSSNGTAAGRESGGGGGGAPSGATPGGGLDWRDMLKQRSNRLSDDDRRRIQLFFVDQTNPTPNDGEPIHRIKLHEERAVDNSTGLPIKETYYLELDYNTYTSRQSKKIKRYKEGQ